MPINPDIPLAVRPVSPIGLNETPMESQAKAVALQGNVLEQQQKIRALRTQQAFGQAIAENGGDVEKALPQLYRLDPMTAMGIHRQLTADKQKAALGQMEAAKGRREAQRMNQEHFDFVAQRFGSILDAPEDQQADLYQKTRTDWINRGLMEPQDMPEQYDAQALKQATAGIQKMKKSAPGGIHVLNGVNNPDNPDEVGSLVVNSATGEPIHFFGGPGKGANTEDVQNVKDTVAGWKEGILPPELPGRGSRTYTALMAEAKRQGYDLSKANEDWKATQRYLQTLNGQQQVRLGQAIRFTKESLPLVDQLVEDWHARGPALLTKANLVLAEQGAYGPEWASLARRLKAQIADLTSELGTVYKGGNSSTDESLKLAATNMSADWDYKSMKDALKQIDQNLTIRENSIKHGKVTTLTPDRPNPYAPSDASDPGGLFK